MFAIEKSSRKFVNLSLIIEWSSGKKFHSVSDEKQKAIDKITVKLFKISFSVFYYPNRT